jgi:hypothetical protein
LITVIVRATIVTSKDDRFCCAELDRSVAAALATTNSASAKHVCTFLIFPLSLYAPLTAAAHTLYGFASQNGGEKAAR